MKLGRVGAGYDPSALNSIVQAVETALTAAFRKDRDVEIGVGRVILRSPDGTRWALGVDDAGTVGSTPA